MTDKILKVLNSFGIDRKSDITVALSGGADSVCLLIALCELRDTLGFSLHAAHLNHMLRGDESDGDEEFCKKLCQRLGVDLTVERADVSSAAEKTGESIELAARNIRYEFLSRVAGGFIATAHTADDNLETVIFNLCRGTGLSGLTGIPSRRQNIIRPMLDITREEIEGFLADRGECYRTDSTNLQTVYTRNFIRQKIVPLMEQLNPSLKRTVGGMCRGLEEDEALVAAAVDALYCSAVKGNTADTKRIIAAPPAAARGAIKKYLEQNTGNSTDRKTVDAVLDVCASGGKVNIAGNLFAKSAGGYLTVFASSVDEDFEFPLQKVIQDRELFGHRIKQLSLEDYKKYINVNKKLVFTAVDCDKIQGKAAVRPRRSGDRITLARRGCTKTLKKLYNESAVPEHLRGKLPVIVDDGGVVAVFSLATDERCKITAETKTVLLIEKIGVEYDG